MKKYAILLTFVVVMLLSLTACDDNGFTDINDFWAHYRQAVISQDFEALAAMTNFPLRSYGMRYTDPIVYINEDEFESAFTQFLAQELFLIYICEDGEFTDIILTNYEFIVRNEVLVFLGHDERAALHVNDRQLSGSIEGDWARGYDDIFEVVDGVWKLTAFFSLRSNIAETFSHMPTDTEIEALYQQAVEAMSWFRWEPMPHDSEDTVLNEYGFVYLRVIFDGISSLASLEAYLHTIFTADIVADLMGTALYREFDGVLFALGTSGSWDRTRGDEVHEIIRDGDQRVIYRVTVDVLDLDTLEEVVDTVTYDFVLTLVDGNWLFSNFHMTR